jgi:hypothetical protein
MNMKKKWIVLACTFSVFVVDAAVVKEYQRIDGNDNAPLPGKTLYGNMLADSSIWQETTKDSNYGNRIGIAREGGSLSLTGT